jgi:hypothetical protein
MFQFWSVLYFQNTWYGGHNTHTILNPQLCGVTRQATIPSRGRRRRRRRRRRNQEAHPNHGLNSTFLHKFKFKDKSYMFLVWQEQIKFFQPSILVDYSRYSHKWCSKHIQHLSYSLETKHETFRKPNYNMLKQKYWSHLFKVEKFQT